jgi:hypothetical protein
MRLTRRGFCKGWEDHDQEYDGGDFLSISSDEGFGQEKPTWWQRTCCIKKFFDMGHEFTLAYSRNRQAQPGTE